LKIEEENPFFSSYQCFEATVRGERFARKVIRHWFLELVEKDDYPDNNIKERLDQLEESSNTLEAGEKRG